MWVKGRQKVEREGREREKSKDGETKMEEKNDNKGVEENEKFGKKIVEKRRKIGRHEIKIIEEIRPEKKTMNQEMEYWTQIFKRKGR